MARPVVFVILALAFCLESTRAQGIIWLWGRDPVYNALCPDVPYAVVALPASECRPASYIMCSNGRAIAINHCPGSLRFNATAGWCDQPENVPWPINCPPETEQTYQEGARYMPVEGFCKNYFECVPNSFPVQRTCPDLSYYVHGKPPCVYIIEPYVNDIPEDFLADCLRTDPYSLSILY